LLLEMPLEVFRGPMLTRDPGESFRVESGSLGDSRPCHRKILTCPRLLGFNIYGAFACRLKAPGDDSLKGPWPDLRIPIMEKIQQKKSYPIDPILPALQETVAKGPGAVLRAPPGSGKTTRAPLAFLPLIPPEKGRIVVLEPRRLAAVSAARWMAQTIGEPIGRTLGYSIRFDSRTSEETRIEVVTEGLFIRRLQGDPVLEGIAMVIFDEFHERSLQADLALALCLDLRRALREDLKILVMSATLDCGPVASLLGGFPVISSEGEAFPVEERYLPEDRERPVPERVAAAVVKALRPPAISSSFSRAPARFAPAPNFFGPL